MNQATPFVISEFTNPSGEIGFRVFGQLDGKRVRKNFPTRTEAVSRGESQTSPRRVHARRRGKNLRAALRGVSDRSLRWMSLANRAAVKEASNALAKRSVTPRSLSDAASIEDF
jgi:hypothetical protein